MGYFYEDDDTLEHHGIKGQKWGVRRFQNVDGSLTPRGKRKYYGDSDSYTASNGVKVGAPKNAGVAAFRKVQGSKIGGAMLNGAAKLNTATYGHGKNKATWKRFEEQTRKENEAVREANKAHKAAVKADRDEFKEDYKKNLQEVREKATTKDKLLFSDGTRAKAARLMTKYKDMSYEQATAITKDEAVRNTAILLGGIAGYHIYEINKSKQGD